VWKTNGYNKLSQDEMEEVIQLEALAEKVEQLGIKMKMKYESIEKESEDIINLLAECMNKYEKDLLDLRYDLN